jgi:hypothetical protein
MKVNLRDNAHLLHFINQISQYGFTKSNIIIDQIVYNETHCFISMITKRKQEIRYESAFQKTDGPTQINYFFWSNILSSWLKSPSILSMGRYEYS